jgi:hypothetical protein
MVAATFTPLRLLVTFSATVSVAIALWASSTALLHAAGRDSTTNSSSRISDEDISDAYIYLLGRLMVTRQQQLDFQEGFKWNEVVHRKPGEVK